MDRKLRKPLPEPTPEPQRIAFDEFWTVYPRKVGKKIAHRRFNEVVEAGADPAEIIAAAVAFRRQCEANDQPAKYIRHPARWLWGPESATELPGDLLTVVPLESQPQDAIRLANAESTSRPRPRAKSPRTPVEPRRKPAEKPTEIYRAYDAAGILLYVGVSANTPARLKQHAASKVWWHLVADVQVLDESGYGDFLVDEFEACVNEFPMFNIDGVPWRCWQHSIGRADFDRLRSRAEIAGAVARLDDAGVQGRLSVLRRAYPSTYAAAVETAGRPTDPDHGEEWKRRVLIAAEERHLSLEKKKIPRSRSMPRKAQTESPSWRYWPPKDVSAVELVSQMLHVVNELTGEEVLTQVTEIAAVRPVSWQEHRERAEVLLGSDGDAADRHAICTLIAHYQASGVWPLVVVPTEMRNP